MKKMLCWPTLLKSSVNNVRNSWCLLGGKIVETRRNFSTGLRISEEIKFGVDNGKPVLALESAIISHGMPYPHNIETAFHLQNIVRKMGAIPATVGVLNGTLTVGLSDEEIDILGSHKSDDKPLIKISRRDLPIALSRKYNGGTTVSATIIGAVKAGIHIFATGGIGGVHRGAETSFDISADLKELGRNQIAVVSAGVKSILDIGKTLEYLETEGVCVSVLKDINQSASQNTAQSEKIGSVKFPSFFTAESQFTAPYFLSDELQAAHLVNSSINFQLNSGILIAIPIPKEYEENGQMIEDAVIVALKKARSMGIHGKAETPFLLAEINRLTSGSSLHANKCLVENNVTHATRIAILLSKLRMKPTGVHNIGGLLASQGNPQPTVKDDKMPQEREREPAGKTTLSSVYESNEKNLGSPENHFSNARPRPIPTGRPVVIGGSSIDIIMSVEENEIVEWFGRMQVCEIAKGDRDGFKAQHDGRTHKTKIKTAAGGVARNIAEALGKLGHDPILISSIGDDLFGRELLRHLKRNKMDTSRIFTMKDTSTAIYSALLSPKGECLFGLGDMAINERMDVEVIKSECGEVIKEASMVILDGNLKIDVMTQVMSLCVQNNVAVWFEPTEVRKAKKILQVPLELRKCLRYLSPNLRELMSITQMDQFSDLSKREQFPSYGNNNTFTSNLSEIQSQCFTLFENLELILFTRGRDGIQVISRAENDEGLGEIGRGARTLSALHHPAPALLKEEIKSVSGAGDCLNAGFISGILNGDTFSQCLIKATLCAQKSLQSIHNVPDEF